jgi:hypothetical protein
MGRDVAEGDGLIRTDVEHDSVRIKYCLLKSSLSCSYHSSLLADQPTCALHMQARLVKCRESVLCSCDEEETVL